MLARFLSNPSATWRAFQPPGEARLQGTPLMATSVALPQPFVGCHVATRRTALESCLSFSQPSSGPQQPAGRLSAVQCLAAYACLPRVKSCGNSRLLRSCRLQSGPDEVRPAWQLPPPASMPLARGRVKCVIRSSRVHVASVVPTAAAKAHTDSFENITTEDELLAGIQREVEAKRLPSKAGPGMEIFWRNYRDAVVGSGVEGAELLAVKVMATVFDRIMVQFEDPFTFPSHHTRITEPYDYYAFGQNYIRPLLDFKNSYLGNFALFDDIERQLSEGHNVVLLANHQTEADPAVLALLLETSHPRLATELTYVAGDRVVLDPFCKPFSMGRNLLCVFSKKRINDVPELAQQKMAANRRTLKEMTTLFRKGGNLVWIAPSGGRDRPDPETDEWVPAPFDPSAVDLMRRMLEDSDVPGHLYPMALLCYDIMPPPRTMEKELGEVRIIGYHGVATSVGPPISFNAIAGHVEDKKEARDVFSKAAFDSVASQYVILKEAVHSGKGFAAAKPDFTLSQPWAANQDHDMLDQSSQQTQPTATAALL